jgi:hypothetical protein
VTAFVLTLTILHGLDALCAYFNGDTPDPPWLRKFTRATSLLLALWGAWLIGGSVL